MGLLADEGMMQGPQGRMDMGDYVVSQSQSHLLCMDSRTAAETV